MKNQLRAAIEKLSAGEALVLTAVTDTTGSVPRGAGAKMVVTEQGLLQGTVGGGAIEHRCLELAQAVLREQVSRQAEFVLNENDLHRLGMICGGSAQVYLQYIPGKDPDALAALEKAASALERGGRLWLVTDMTNGRLAAYSPEDAPGELLPWLSRRPVRVQLQDRELFIEQISDGGTVYIFGAGHVGRELEPLLSKVGFRCVVVDDRPAFADRTLFPTAAEVICADLAALDGAACPGKEDYACIMTRGHAHDTEVLAQVLRAEPRYVGLMGSRRKIAALHKVLQEEYGITKSQLEKLTAPIGLEIGAQTPAEIAVSVAAQLIAERSKDFAK